jgi:hypothetical protein
MLRRVRDAGPRVSMRRLLSELDTIREVVNIYPKKGRRKAVPLQTVLSRTSDLQRELMSILGIEKEETSILG